MIDNEKVISGMGAKDMLKDRPEVVRCKDCKYCEYLNGRDLGAIYGSVLLFMVMVFVIMEN